MKEWNNVILVGTGEVKNLTIVNSNVNDEFVSYAIRDTQNINLQGIIGTALFDKIKELVFNKIKGLDNSIDEVKYAAYNDLLEDFIKPYVIHKSVVNVLIPISYKVRNAGAVKTSDTNISNADISEVKYLMNYYEEQANFYETRLSKFLCTYYKSFPELEMNDESWMSQPLVGKNFANTELWLGKDNEKSCNC